jgi:L-rhamnose-H+ transport protein
MDIIKSTPAAHFLDVFHGCALGHRWPYVWIAMRYLGLSLGMSVALGFTSAFGSLVPPLYRDLVNDADGVRFSQMLQSTGGLIVLAGVVVCLIGIFVCGRAGMMKEGELTDDAKKKASKNSISVKACW